jgi:hypothetical protein
VLVLIGTLNPPVPIRQRGFPSFINLIMALDRQQLLMMARYHVWSTHRLLLAVEALDD